MRASKRLRKWLKTFFEFGSWNAEVGKGVQSAESIAHRVYCSKVQDRYRMREKWSYKKKILRKAAQAPELQ